MSRTTSHKNGKHLPKSPGCLRSADTTGNLKQETIETANAMRAERQLRASLKKIDDLKATLEEYKDLCNFATMGYCTIDESGKILWVNLAAAALIGVEQSKLVNRPLQSFISSNSVPSFHTYIAKAFSGMKFQNCEVLLLNRVWANFRDSSAISLQGTRRSCRFIVEDISARKHITQLTSREKEVLKLVAEGKTNKQAGLELGIRLKTVEKHREHLMEKLDIHETASLTRFAISSATLIDWKDQPNKQTRLWRPTSS